MKIEFEIPNEEIDLLLSAMSQAIYSYRNTVVALSLGCEVPTFIVELFERNGIDDYSEQVKYVKDRFKILKKIYQDMLEKYDKMEEKRNESRISY